MLYLFTIFVSAFLLFQVQPLIAKLILPLFGGGAAVWTSCLLFFQGLLLAGYFYAHCLTQLKNIRAQVAVHGALLAASVAFLPIGIPETATALAGGSPLAGILMLLMVSVGLPYLLLSATGPLVQRWLSYENVNKLPYKLYSLSNVGSLLALLSYPFLFEPLYSLAAQTAYWSLAYGVFVLAIGTLCVRLYRHHPNLTSGPKSLASQVVVNSKSQTALWLLLSATGVVLLVATTNAMTQDVPPVPFLWVLPLSLYLLTFIISFHSPRWYVRWYWFALFFISALAAVLMFFIGTLFDIFSQVGIYSVILFSACMICHGELARLKPEVERLTLFYLMISLGGFLGTALVAFVATKLFTSFLEFPLAVFAVFALFSASIYWHRHSAHEPVEPHSQRLSHFSVGSLVVIAGLFFYMNSLFVESDVAATRNFYGILSVKDVEVQGRRERRLVDGHTSHGAQSLEHDDQHIPMSYYRENTGAALALEYSFPDTSISVGLVGLGAGTLAAYGETGDYYHFYEINPAVIRYAQRYFTYLENSRAEVDITLGDARVSLARELEEQGSQQYHVLVVDAFSGDSIPAHLLTQEALALYRDHLAPDGLIALHISNSHLDLTPLVRGLAQTLNKQAVYFETSATGHAIDDAKWAIITNNRKWLNHPQVLHHITPWPARADDPIVWTDDYSNLLSVLK
ncbi:fused MFS/spermidine synthase [Marinimicrobium sp. ABcell2]|uniref:fused MFS/spermidine synthase n=1 Tax=Marinimicrobium sp. ABcell2 TaxID=3069751 RepID=UPI0027B72EAD|nr:fused MFS/spermidine synthase [Marinimicrobium sp. ABcell2]MDQ2077823.1 fused MFS/spermidine synthase [Marinimicrobium sp. ABcell2]